MTRRDHVLRKQVLRRTAGLGLAGALAFAGCSAQVSDDPTPGGGTGGTGGENRPGGKGGGAGAGNTGGGDKPGGGGAGGGAQAGSGGAGGGGAPIGPVAACKPGGEGLTLRRLNRAEYNNTVRDLLGDTTQPALAFPADSSNSGFDNNLATLSIPPLLAEQYDATAERLVDAAWSRDAGAAAAARKLRRCDFAAGKEADCARQTLEAFLPRAFRRPTTPEEVTRFVGLFETARKGGEPAEGALKLALRAVLMSANFLFRIDAESDPAKPAGQYALASRLSYYLWSSMPDDALMGLAAKGELAKPDVLRKEVRRMLADPKAEALTKEFAGQWLDLRLVEGVNPDAKIFPDLSPDLKSSMRQETELFFQAFLKEDRSALDMLDADFTFMNQPLMEHYGMWEVNAHSKEMKRVTLPKTSKRAGLLGQGSVLAVTSMPDRTSLVKRGEWVLKHLICEPPPPAPANVPPLPAATKSGGKTLTVRQRTEAHRANPACAGCHMIMDPIGFGLEPFDAVGRWRESEGAGGGTIDAKGDYKGKPFNGPKELAAALKADPSFASCMVEKVYSFALGKAKGPEDAQALTDLTKTFADKGHRLGELFVEIAASPRFVQPCGK
jgi:hypothetical protein